MHKKMERFFMTNAEHRSRSIKNVIIMLLAIALIFATIWSQQMYSNYQESKEGYPQMEYVAFNEAERSWIGSELFFEYAKLRQRIDFAAQDYDTFVPYFNQETITERILEEANEKNVTVIFSDELIHDFENGTAVVGLCGKAERKIVICSIECFVENTYLREVENYWFDNFYDYKDWEYREKFIWSFTHEVMHLKYQEANEREIQFRTFEFLYNFDMNDIGDAIIRSSAYQRAWEQVMGYDRHEYDAGYQIAQYFAANR